MDLVGFAFEREGEVMNGESFDARLVRWVGIDFSCENLPILAP